MRFGKLFGLIIILIGANLLLWSMFGLIQVHANTIYPGVEVEHVSIANLSQSQAIATLEPIKTDLLGQQMNLTIDNKTFHPTLTQLGYQINTPATVANAFRYGHQLGTDRFMAIILHGRKMYPVPFVYSVDDTIFAAYFSAIGEQLASQPKNISLDYRDGKIVVVPAEDGTSLQPDQVKSAIQSQIKPGKTKEINLAITKTQPELSDPSQVGEAKATLDKLLAQPLVIQADDTQINLDQATLYSFITYDIQDNNLVVKFDNAKVKDAVAGLAKKIDVTAVTKLVLSTDSSTNTEGRDGKKLNQAQTVALILDRLNQNDTSTPLTVPVDKIDRKMATIEPEFQLGRYEGKYIDISLRTQKMHIIESSNVVGEFRVSTGKWSTPTPKGEFSIHNHVPVAWSAAFHLYMPHWMAITDDGGYGIHGLPYWPGGRKEGVRDIGTPVSHGCIRLGPGDEETVYNWAENGTTKVYIHD